MSHFLSTILFVTLLVLPSFIRAESPCHWGHLELLSKAQVEECLETVGWEKSQTEQLFGNLKQYIDMDPFEPDFIDPPTEFEWLSYNRLEELKELEKKANEGTYQYEYGVYENLIKLLKKSYDPNTYLTLPQCYEDIVYFQLIRPIPRMVNGETIVTFAFIDENAIHPYEIFSSRYPEKGYYHSDFLIPLQGDKIVRINGLEPIDYYMRLALDLNISKDKGVLFNAALSGEGRQGTLGDGFPIDNEIVYTVLHEEEEIDVAIPYIYLSLHKIENKEQFAGMCHNTIEINKEETNIPEYFMLNAKRNYALPRYHLVNIRVKGELEELARKLGEEDGMVMLNIRAQIREKHVKNIDSYVGWSKFRLEDYADYGRGYWIQHYSDRIDRRVTVVRIPGPMDRNSIKKDMMKEIIDIARKGDRLIIDLRGNTGKILSTEFSYEVSPEDADYEPVSRNWRIKRGEVVDELFENGILEKSNLMSYISTPIEKLKKNKKTIKYENKDKKFEVDYTPYFFVGRTSFIDKDGEKHSFIYEEFIRRLKLDKTQVVVLTDGLCGSSCASFIWTIKDTLAARIITIGGFKTDVKIVRPSAISYSGELITSSDEIVNDINKVNPTILSNKKLPGKLPYGMVFHFPIAKEFSPYESSDNAVLNFSPLAPTQHSYWYGNRNPEKSADRDYPELLDELWELMDFHSLPGAIKSIDAKVMNVPCPETNKSEVYGHKWNEDDNDYTGSCIFLHCGKGYYMEERGARCVSVPVEGTEHLDALGMMDIEYLYKYGPFFTFLVFVIMVVIVMLSLLCVVNSKE